MSATSVYSYRAVRADGTIELGILEADTRAAASERISARGLFVLELRLDAPDTEGRTPVSHRDAALGLRMLGSLLESGLPVARALHAFTDLVPPSWRSAMPTLHDAIRDGKSLSAGLGASGLSLPSYVLGIVRAGEASGTVGGAMQQAARIMESAAETRAAIRGALTYPLVLAAAGTASIAFLVFGVLPKFAVLLASLGQTLPPTTRFVLDTASLVRAGAVPFVITVAAGTLLWRSWTSSETGLVTWHGWLLSLPVLGATRHSLATSRAASALSALLATGVPVAAALVHAARASGDASLSGRVLRARESVVAGAALSRALAEQRALTATAVRLIGSGEQSGQLPQMLAHAAQIEDERARISVRSAVRLVEPSLILVFGGLVALVAAALLQAVYSVRPGT